MKDEILNFIEKQIKKAREFVMSKDLWVFLFFLAISATLWLMQASSEKGESTIQIPIQYQEIPEGFCKSEQLCPVLEVTVTDQWQTLFKYHAKMAFAFLGYGFDTIKIGREKLQEGKNLIQAKSFEAKLKEQLNANTKIESYSPDTIKVSIFKIEKKTVPVKLVGKIRLRPQYIQIGDVSISPDKVEIFGTKETLDKIDSLETLPADSLLNDIFENTTQIVPLKKSDNISFNESQVVVDIKAEQVTEKMIDVVGINKKNVPANLTLKTFPAYVGVKCKVGVSNWDKVTPSSFTLVVDYNKINNKSNKVNVEVANCAEGIFGISLHPEQVEFIIETKTEQ